MLMDAKTALFPTDVIERNGHHLAGAETVSGDQEQHRVVAQPHGRRRIDRSQKRLHRIPGKGTRQLLRSVKPRRVDLIQPMRNPAVYREESKEPAHGRDLLLQACPAQTLTGLENIPLYIARLNRLERDFLRIEVIQKAPGHIAAGVDIK